MTKKINKISIFDLIDQYFEDYREWAEQFREKMVEKPSWNQRACTIEPLRDMSITPSEVVITIDLPYTEEKKVKIKNLDDKIIEVSAKIRKKIRFDDFGITYRRGEFNMFYCQTQIPVPVYIDQITTRYNKGILEIRLPRKDIRQIRIE